MRRDLVILDATPAMADGTVPVSFADRGPVSRLTWLERTPVFPRLPALVPGTRWNVHALAHDPDLARDCHEMVAIGMTIFAFGFEPASPEVAAAGGGRHITVVGVNDDGTRAAISRGREWRLTADGQYPWPTTANAL